MAIHTLVTGANGAGKTLMGVSRVLAPLVGTELEKEDGTKVPRRLVVGGVRDLLIDHVMMDIPRWDSEVEPSPFSNLKREPGDAPLDVPYSLLSWWAWCLPGDVLFIDEAQRAFRPMASGRRVPMFIEKLETARHYGVELVYVTQHPNLLHTNVRNLVGLHRHVRRIFGWGRCLVYEWDHCSNPDRTKDSVATYFKHDKKAFSLYKSAEIHTKHKAKVPLPAFLALAAIVALPVVGYSAYSRVHETYHPTAHVASSSASVPPRGGAASGVAAWHAPAGWESVPKLGGCFATASSCKCQDVAGRPVGLADAMCRASAAGSGLVAWEPRAALPVGGPAYGAAAATAQTEPTPSSKAH